LARYISLQKKSPYTQVWILSVTLQLPNVFLSSFVLVFRRHLDRTNQSEKDHLILQTSLANFGPIRIKSLSMVIVAG
jgi:hypothetical protein